MSRSATVTLTFVGDTSQLDQVYESFVRKASKPIAVPLTGAAAGAPGAAAVSPTTFANASVPGATPAAPAAGAPGIPAAATASAVQQVSQAYTNLANAINQQAATVVRMTQAAAQATAPGTVPGWPGNVGAWAVPPGAPGQPVPPPPPQPQPQPPQPPQPQPPQRPARPGQGRGGGLLDAIGQYGGLGFVRMVAASEAFRLGVAGNEYNSAMLLAGSDQRAQLKAEQDYQKAAGSFMVLGPIADFAANQIAEGGGYGRTGTAATLASADAIDARTAAMGGWRRQTRNLRDQVTIAAATNPLDRNLAEINARANREQESLREASAERAKLDERDVEQFRIGLAASRRSRANSSFGPAAVKGETDFEVFVGGHGDERDRREAALANDDATAVSGMRTERELQRNSALRTDQMLAGRRNYLDVQAAVREDMPRRAAVQRMADDVSVYAVRGARRFQAASRLELEADIRQDVEGDANPATREVRRQRGAARLAAFDADRSLDNQTATQVANLMAESIRRATAGDTRGALESRQRARRRGTLAAADFSTPETAALYEARRQEDLAEEGSENRDLENREYFRTRGLEGVERSTALAARGQNLAARAQGIYDRGGLEAEQAKRANRPGEQSLILRSTLNELQALKLNYQQQGEGAEFGAGTLAAGGTQGNKTLEDMGQTMKLIDAKMAQLIAEIQKITTGD